MHKGLTSTVPFGVYLLQGAYNKLNDQSCKRVLHAVVHNRALKEVRLVGRQPEDVLCMLPCV